MSPIRRYINRKLSVQISFKVVLAIALLLTTALYVMLYFSRRAVKQEALNNAEMTLETTVRQIDNVLLSCEQALGNVYWEMLMHLDNPDLMFTYAEQLVRSDPYIAGCAIAYEPYYYPQKGEYFMAYVHRSYTDALGSENSPLYRKTWFGNVPYTRQSWYRQAIESGAPSWIDPLKNEAANGVAITSFCMPIYGHGGQRIGVIAVDVTLSLLSKILLAAKTSPRSYAVLLGSDGSYIVHPDAHKINRKTIYMEVAHNSDPDFHAAVEAMMKGETGYKHFNLNGMDSYVFYKPFQRAAVSGRTLEDSGWHVGFVYPEEDIFGDYNRLLYIVIIIAVVGLFLLYLSCRTIVHRQLVPLRLLTNSAQRIADGHYNEPVPDTRQQDEVGMLQNHFQQMQQALSAHVGELERLTTHLRKQGEVLAASYDRAKEAERVKTAFLHNMTDQMIPPVKTIERSVVELFEQQQSREQMAQLVGEIQTQGKVVTELLNHLLQVSVTKDGEVES
ncbi:MAG: HAMP domain-containing protein [Prevotella sp.]|nr:HAMP domain-containing protein [Prevotella sp.]